MFHSRWLIDFARWSSTRADPSTIKSALEDVRRFWKTKWTGLVSHWRLQGSVKAKIKLPNFYLIVQNARKTHGTFSRCHSFSTSADSPKLVAKFFACSNPFNSVLMMSNDELHKAIFDKANGIIAANAGECFKTCCGNGNMANSNGIIKLNGNIVWMLLYFGPRWM